jgi:hypothetical protein
LKARCIVDRAYFEISLGEARNLETQGPVAKAKERNFFIKNSKDFAGTVIRPGLQLFVQIDNRR